MQMLRHAHLAHDGKAPLVLVALRDLLVVDDEHGGHQKDHTEEDSQEEEGAVDGVELLPVLLPALDPP